MALEQVIRTAKKSDLLDIMTIEACCFEEDRFSKKQFIYLITESKGVFLVVEQADKVIAYITLLAHCRRSNLRLYSLAVHPSFKQMHLAQRLIDAGVQYAYQHALKSITLEVATSNAAAIQLYKKNLFELEKSIKDYYAKGKDAFYMKRKLY